MNKTQGGRLEWISPGFFSISKTDSSPKQAGWWMNKAGPTGGMITPSCWLNAATTTQALIPVLLWWEKKNELGQGGLLIAILLEKSWGIFQTKCLGKCSVLFFEMWICECSALLGWSMVVGFTGWLFWNIRTMMKIYAPTLHAQKKTKKFHELIPKMAIVVKPVSSFQPVHHFEYPFAKFRGCSS